jgi:hypothetical protein
MYLFLCKGITGLGPCAKRGTWRAIVMPCQLKAKFRASKDSGCISVPMLEKSIH